MKILQIRFKNLNALYGEWLIDLRDPAFLSQGIFAITGPTGSGKSTILDAICLALYGATPRLGKITKSRNDIMSRQTGECFSEVIFETQSGTYLCQFSHRRAKKSPEGNLQEPEHQIAYGNGELIESKKNLVGQVVIEKTGMDFERFTRSMLLAQGGFDSFLKASDDDKSKILQQITASTLYSEISKYVFLKHKEAKEEYHLLSSKIDLLSVIDEETLIKLKTQQNDLLAEFKKTSITLEKFKKDKEWILNTAKLAEEISLLTLSLKQALEAKKSFSAKDLKLKLALKASQLEIDYQRILTQKNTTVEKSLKLKEYSHHLSLLNKTSCDANILLEQYSVQLKNNQSQYQELLPLIETTEALDHNIYAVSQQTELLNKQIGSLSQETLLNKKKQLELETLFNEKTQALTRSRDYMANQGAIIEPIYASRTTLELQLQQWTSLQKELTNLTHQLAKQNQEKDSILLNYNTQKENLSKVMSFLESLKLDRVKLSEHFIQLNSPCSKERLILEKEHLTKSLYFIDTIQSLESQRAKLQADNPCPLCGSLEHPYVSSNSFEEELVTTKNRLSLIDNTLNLFSENEVAQTKNNELINKTQHELEIMQSAIKNLEEKKIHVTEQISTLDLNINNKSHELKQLINTINQQLKPFKLNMTDFPIAIINKTLLNTYSKHKEHLDFLQKGELEIYELQKQMTSIKASIETHNTHLEQAKKELTLLQYDLANLRAQRSPMFANIAPKSLRHNLQQSVEKSRQLQIEAQESVQQATVKVDTCQNMISSLIQELQQLDTNTSTLEANFLLNCHNHGFSTLEEFLDSRTPLTEIETLQAQSKAIESDILKLQTLLDKSQQDHKTLSELSLTELSLEEISHHIITLAAQNESTAQERIKIESLLNQDAKTRIKLEEVLITQQKAKSELDKLDKLNLLIGSADGKKFRHFAQGITFEILVQHANQQLTKMNDRYLLIRDDSHALALNVIDNYQAGEIRTINNLSGGESFIISLALALGLSQMSSQNIKVDSLFLDEGFGTLDEEALDMALDALSSLHHENKMIGIISHVPQLKNRIMTQISIDAQNGGRSLLTGPGCYKI